MRRKGISSIYGFIMIFLLTMASIQTWSAAVGSISSLEGASEQSHQLQQMQAIEHLSLSSDQGNLTIANNGEVPSTIEFLRLIRGNGSETVEVNKQLAIGSSLQETLPSGDGVEVVTALGNVFTLWPDSGLSSPVWLGSEVVDGSSNAQLYESPYDSSFFLATGSYIFAFLANGTEQWSYDFGTGVVTNVLPVSPGDVFVSVAYGPSSNVASLYDLSSTGSISQTYPVRIFQYPQTGVATLLPASAAESSGYAYYDGWFYSATGPSGGITSDAFPVLGSDSSDVYFYTVVPETYDGGVCGYPGNQLEVTSYRPEPASAGGYEKRWIEYVDFGSCNAYPQELVSSSVNSGVIAAIFESPSYSSSPVEQYPAENPYVCLISSAGQLLYNGQAPLQGYTSIANDGSTAFLALPQSSEIQVLSAGDGTYSTYHIGIQASDLSFEYGRLFAVSTAGVEVFDSSMQLQQTISFAPLSLASYSDSSELQTIQSPSFVVLNSTTYAALVTNSTGYLSLTLGTYT